MQGSLEDLKKKILTKKNKEEREQPEEETGDSLDKLIKKVSSGDLKDALEALYQSARFSQLQICYLTQLLRPLRLEGAQALGERLKGNSALQQLILRANKVGDEGVRALGEGLKGNSVLQQLILEGNASAEENEEAEMLRAELLASGDAMDSKPELR